MIITVIVIIVSSVMIGGIITVLVVTTVVTIGIMVDMIVVIVRKNVIVKQLGSGLGFLRFRVLYRGYIGIPEKEHGSYYLGFRIPA